MKKVKKKTGNKKLTQYEIVKALGKLLSDNARTLYFIDMINDTLNLNTELLKESKRYKHIAFGFYRKFK